MVEALEWAEYIKQFSKEINGVSGKKSGHSDQDRLQILRRIFKEVSGLKNKMIRIEGRFKR